MGQFLAKKLLATKISPLLNRHLNGKILVDTVERQFVLDGESILYMMPIKKTSLALSVVEREEFAIKFKNGVNILITQEEFTQICDELGLLENSVNQMEDCMKEDLL